MPNWPDLQILGQYNGSLSRVITVPGHSDLPTIGNRMCDLAVLDSFCLTRKLFIKSPAIKRAMDILFILFCGLFMMPFVAIIALLIKLDSRGPLIYGQRRIGRHGREFRAWKFRTMVLDADRLLEQYLAADPQLRKEWQMDHKLKNDPRVTRIGRWLRKTSLDELPQLWNILIGQMSLVGPRAIVEAEIPKYGESFEAYKAVLPGLTGLWQYPVAITPPIRNVYNWITITYVTGLSGSIYISRHAPARLCSAPKALTDGVLLTLNRSVLSNGLAEATRILFFLNKLWFQ
jgi:lipopolysaccharide/colanic/teichoic acid biosynthesis glycosyltransferase